MEFMIVVMIGIILLFLLGVPMHVFLSGLCILLLVSDAICLLFFLLALCLSMPAKKQMATFKEIRKGDVLMAHAVYEVNGEEVPSLFPTDLGLDKLFYQRKEVAVWVREIMGKRLLFDKMSYWIIGVGNVSFLLLGIALAYMVA